MPSQGYQIIATGAERYLTMASACAASLRLFDGTRPIQLVTDRTVEALADHPYRGLFDDITRIADGATRGEALDPAAASAIKVFGTEFYLEAFRLLMEILGPIAPVLAKVRTA